MKKEMLKLLSDRKLKATPQRLEIINFLMNTKSHPSAEEVYSYIKSKFPTISFATVYNTLLTLKEHGELKELSIDPERKRFDMDLSPHNHFFCKVCKRVFDVFDDFDKKIDVSQSIDGNKVEEVTLFYKGICSNCLKIQR